MWFAEEANSEMSLVWIFVFLTITNFVDLRISCENAVSASAVDVKKAVILNYKLMNRGIINNSQSVWLIKLESAKVQQFKIGMVPSY